MGNDDDVVLLIERGVSCYCVTGVIVWMVG